MAYLVLYFMHSYPAGVIWLLHLYTELNCVLLHISNHCQDFEISKQVNVFKFIYDKYIVTIFRGVDNNTLLVHIYTNYFSK